MKLYKISGTEKWWCPDFGGFDDWLPFSRHVVADDIDAAMTACRAKDDLVIDSVELISGRVLLP